jgi:hypothetical protein
LIHFGSHYLPIDTARSFWIYDNPQNIGFEGPLVQVTLGIHKHPKQYVVLQMRTGSLERAYLLATELLTQTSATFLANFKAITPRVTKIEGRYHGSVEFEFWSREKLEVFNILIAAVFFSEKQFLKKQTEMRALFIAKIGGNEIRQITRIRDLLRQVNRITSGDEVGILLRKNGDRRFILLQRSIDYPELNAGVSSYLNQYTNPSFVVMRDKLYRICFSRENVRSEMPLFDASSIFRFVGEPATPVTRPHEFTDRLCKFWDD